MTVKENIVCGAVALALTGVVLLCSYAGMNEALCDMVKEGRISTLEQTAMKLSPTDCALPWYKRL